MNEYEIIGFDEKGNIYVGLLKPAGSCMGGIGTGGSISATMVAPIIKLNFKEKAEGGALNFKIGIIRKDSKLDLRTYLLDSEGMEDFYKSYNKFIKQL